VREVLLTATSAPPTEAEVQRSIVATESSLVFSLEDALTRAETLQTFSHYTGDSGGLARYLADVKSVTPQRAFTAARKVLLKPRALIVTLPEKRS
jgi:predicted Zn-dependent peptidase